jgi:hypothetical protein
MSGRQIAGWNHSIKVSNQQTEFHSRGNLEGATFGERLELYSSESFDFPPACIRVNVKIKMLKNKKLLFYMQFCVDSELGL